MKYQLTEPHYIDGRYLEAGTMIGEGTDVPFLERDGKPKKPTPGMIGMDAASKKWVAEVTGQWHDPLDEMTPVDAPVVDLSDPSGGK